MVFDDLPFPRGEQALPLGNLGGESIVQFGHGVRPALKEAADERQVVELMGFGLVALGDQTIAQLLDMAMDRVLPAPPGLIVGRRIRQARLDFASDVDRAGDGPARRLDR